MNCPVCVSTTLTVTERQGIEIDFCPKCRGVWLDRGELDKILERSSVVQPQIPPPSTDPRLRYDRDRDDDDDDRRYGKRKKSFWHEIFD